MLVENARVQSIENLISRALWCLLKYPEILKHLGINLLFIVVGHGVLTQEIKNNNIWWLQRDMFVTERAAANSISFIFALLTASS